MICNDRKNICYQDFLFHKLFSHAVQLHRFVEIYRLCFGRVLTKGFQQNSVQGIDSKNYNTAASRYLRQPLYMT